MFVLPTGHKTQLLNTMYMKFPVQFELDSLSKQTIRKLADEQEKRSGTECMPSNIPFLLFQ